MSGSNPEQPPKPSLVFRSLHLFEEDDTELRMIAARAGVTKSELIRGMVHVHLNAWKSMTENRSAPDPHFLSDLRKVIGNGSVSGISTDETV